MGRRHRRIQTCAYCGAPDADTVDHVVPLSRSRECRVPRRILDNKSNRVPCCARCNAAKASTHPRDWLAAHPEYMRRLKCSAPYLSDTVRIICGLDDA